MHLCLDDLRVSYFKSISFCDDVNYAELQTWNNALIYFAATCGEKLAIGLNLKRKF